MEITAIKLLDGTRAFVQCVVDNFSRNVIAHSVSDSYGGLQTKALLESALTKVSKLNSVPKPVVVVDSGTENLNGDVDKLVAAEKIDRITA